MKKQNKLRLYFLAYNKKEKKKKILLYYSRGNNLLCMYIYIHVIIEFSRQYYKFTTITSTICLNTNINIYLKQIILFYFTYTVPVIKCIFIAHDVCACLMHG